jgi:hypothetical protein
MTWVNLLGPTAADQYRRTLSRDRLVVPAAWIGRMPNSAHDPVGYVPVEQESESDMSICDYCAQEFNDAETGHIDDKTGLCFCDAACEMHYDQAGNGLPADYKRAPHG